MTEETRLIIAALRADCAENDCSDCPAEEWCHPGNPARVPVKSLDTEAADLLERLAEAIDNLTAALEASYAVREDERKDRRNLEKAFIEHAHDQIIKKKGPYICRYCVHGGDPYTIDPGKDCPPGCNGVNHWEWGGLPDQNGGAEHD